WRLVHHGDPAARLSGDHGGNDGDYRDAGPGHAADRHRLYADRPADPAWVMDASIPAPALAQSIQPPGLWRQGWYRFRRNRGGMLGLILVVLVVLVALTCPILAPHDPQDQSAMLRGGARAAP